GLSLEEWYLLHFLLTGDPELTITASEHLVERFHSPSARLLYQRPERPSSLLQICTRLSVADAGPDRGLLRSEEPGEQLRPGLPRLGSRVFRPPGGRLIEGFNREPGCRFLLVRWLAFGGCAGQPAAAKANPGWRMIGSQGWS